MQAVTVVFGFALLSFPFPVLLVFSTGALVLITLQLGIRQSISVLAICILLLGFSTFLIIGKITIEHLLAWLSTVILALVYRNTRSLNLTLQILLIIGVAITVLIAVIAPDQKAYWLEYFQGIYDQWITYLNNLYETATNDPEMQQILNNARHDSDQVKEYLPIVASVMTGVLMSLCLLILSLSLFLGRWWQGLYTSTRVFRKEFISLRLGKVLAILAVIFVVTALVANQAILWQLAIVCLSIFSLQGMAIGHAIIGQFSYATLGFIAVYGLLFVAAPQMIMALSAIGVLDTFINFRMRFAKSST